MAKLRTLSTALAALTLTASPGVAHATESAPGTSTKVITSDTKFKFGQKGVLKLDGWDRHYKSRKSPVAVRVVKIEKGKRSDLKGHGLPVSATGMVPYYIRAEFIYVGADWEGGGPSFSGMFSDGSSATAVITSEDIGPCAANGPSHELSKKKRVARDCTVVLAPAGVPVTGAFLFHSVDKHRSIQVTWKK